MTISRRTIVLLAVSTAILFEALDIAIVNLAMPLIQKDFALTGESVQWIQTLYVLFYGGFLIVGGKLSDVVGRKLVFLIGAGLFLLTSLGAALSTSLPMLCVFRAIQGLGAAFVMPAAFSIITNTFTEAHERNRALGIFGSFAAIGSGSGLSLGGIIATFFGWKWVFFINVPVIGLSMLFSYLYIQKDDSPHDRKSADYLTGILLTLSIVMLTYLVHTVRHLADDLMEVVIMLALIGIFTVIISRRSKSENALIKFSIFNTPSTRIGNLVMFMMGAFFTGYLFMISMVFQTYMHFTAAEAGLVLFPFSVLSAVVSKSILPRLLRRISVEACAILGMSLMFVGGLTLSLAVISNYNLLFILLSIACVTGTGIAVCFLSLNVIALRDIPEAHHGVASSFINTCFFFGGGLGLSILSLFISESNPVVATIVLTLYALPGAVILIIANTSGRLSAIQQHR